MYEYKAKYAVDWNCTIDGAALRVARHAGRQVMLVWLHVYELMVQVQPSARMFQS